MAGFRRICALTAACGLLVPAAASAATGGGTPAPGGDTTGSAAASGGSSSDRPTATPAPSSPATRADLPSAYLTLYRQAARRYSLDWRLLAAIGKNESDHGRSPARGVRSGLNFARCCAGPMQLCTVASCGLTWQAYAVDGNADGRLSVYDPADAIFTAARLLSALRLSVGARADLLLASYNAGPAYVARHRRVPPYRETQAYVISGLQYMRTL